MGRRMRVGGETVRVTKDEAPILGRITRSPRKPRSVRKPRSARKPRKR